MACRYSSWSKIYKAKDGLSKELVSRLRDYMGTLRVMDECATDGPSVYKSAKTQEFLAKFCFRHRLWSAYNPHSNQLAEDPSRQARGC